jgi:hypothetical protein
MNHKRITMTSIVLGTLMLVSLFAAVSSAASVSGTTMAGTGPAVAPSGATPPTGFNGWFDFFAVDTSGTLSHGANGNWDSLGGTCTASPAAVSWNSNYYRLDVFVRGSDGAVWQKYYQNGWSGWHSLGGQLAAGTGPAVASWSAGRLDVFAEGANGALYHKWWNGATWSGWESLGGKLTASPAASSQGTNQIGVFVRGTNGACWYKEWTGTAWSSWESLGGQLAPNTGPGVTGNEVFVQGTDNQLWWQQFGGAGSAWRSLPACPEALSASSPAVVFDSQGHTEVFVSTTSGNLMGCTAWSSGWEWWSVGNPP